MKLWQRIKKAVVGPDWENGTLEVYNRRGELVFAWNYGEDREVTEERRRS
jgi:hypothetical protein